VTPIAARVLWGMCDPLFTPQPLGPVLDMAEAAGGELAEVVRAAGPGAIWVADNFASTLTALSPQSGQPTASILLPSAPFGVAFGSGSVWATSPACNCVIRVDPATREPGQQIQVGAGPTAIAYGLGAVWVANELDSTISRINPGTDAVAAAVSVGDGPDALAVAGNSVWAAARPASVRGAVLGRHLISA
jgi:YVTN family beta-propeller protein